MMFSDFPIQKLYKNGGISTDFHGIFPMVFPFAWDFQHAILDDTGSTLW